MTDIERFLKSPSVIGVLAADSAEAGSLRYTYAAPTAIERELRGAKMTTVQGVFDECAAAWQFPYYFGENKDAFDECMRELDEFVGVAPMYLVVVRDAEQLLRDEPHEMAWFIESMRFYAGHWAGLAEPVTFRVVLQTSDEAALAALHHEFPIVRP